jgi:hypothetical protein
MDSAFTDEERALLEDVIRECMADLRIEIANTDDFTFRQALKKKAELLQLILAKCERPTRIAKDQAVN